MNFFERQNVARRKSILLLVYYIPAVTLIVLVIYAVIALIFDPGEYRFILNGNWWIHPTLFVWVAGIVLTIILGGSIYKMIEISGGGRIIAIMLGGNPVSPQTTDPDEQRLRDVVEEMAIASGQPVPEIFVLRSEQGINSFVAGRSSEDTVLGVTQGALKLLTRDELQGIVAHEFSHILNGDNRLSFWLIGLLHGILCISLLGKLMFRLMDKTETDNRAVGTLGLVAVALVVVGWIGYAFGRLIKCAVCRKREELADAAAVQFTRNPEAIASALKKIGGLSYGSRLTGVNCEQADFIFFGDILQPSWFRLFDTHPPLDKRIRLLDPGFDGIYPPLISWEAQQKGGWYNKIKTPSQSVATEALSAVPPIINNPNSLIAAAALSPRNLTYAAGLRASFSERMMGAAREPFSATALIYALLLSDNARDRQIQLDEAATLTEEALLTQAIEYLDETSSMTNGQKLALVNLSLHALRQMSAEQFTHFYDTVKVLSESDRTITLFEFTLQKILLRYLTHFYKKGSKPVIQYYSINQLQSECSTLLSMLAWHGGDDELDVKSAFQAGAAFLEFKSTVELLPRDQCTLANFDKSLDILNQTSMLVRRNILDACAAVVASDNVIKEQEAQLLRAIAESLNCSLPPLVSELDSEPLSD